MSRTRMTALAVVTASLAAAMLLIPAVGQDSQADPVAQKPQAAKTLPQKKASPLKVFMQQKLDASNLVLEGLLTEDYKKIEKGGRKFREMGAAEKWRVSNDMMYRHHSEDFQRNVDKLIESASKAESLDRIALAWFDTTLSCIDCHRWVRTVLVADSDAPLTLPIAAAPQTND